MMSRSMTHLPPPESFAQVKGLSERLQFQLMKTPSSVETLIPRETTRRTPVTGLSPELLSQSARRLRIVALLYAFVFFMSDPLQALLFSEERARFFASALRWAPSTISIVMAL